ncbi:hypothetical protein DRN73_04035 [Candidatus Pacearchaeota archaeon]|nr:MAG: hypothetical protein DRN73_04035 [Candidatus Pacearchaeota archaeon]
MTEQFNNKNIFEYNFLKKISFITFAVLGILLFIGIILYYYFALSKIDNFFINSINFIINNIKTQITQLTALGAFYTTLFGGLFFIPLPTEILFFAFLKKGVMPFALVLIYVLGFTISFTFNYLVGTKLSNISKKIIRPKKFYKIKVAVNKYGMATVFAFNVLPLPAQPLSAVLGVFKYNKTKFYIAFILGQLIKFSIIALAYFYIL